MRLGHVSQGCSEEYVPRKEPIACAVVPFTTPPYKTKERRTHANKKIASVRLPELSNSWVRIEVVYSR